MKNLEKFQIEKDKSLDKKIWLILFILLIIIEGILLTLFIIDIERYAILSIPIIIVLLGIGGFALQGYDEQK